MSKRVWKFDTKMRKDHVGIITIFLVMVLLQKEHCGSVKTTVLSPLFFPLWKGKDFCPDIFVSYEHFKVQN